MQLNDLVLFFSIIFYFTCTNTSGQVIHIDFPGKSNSIQFVADPQIYEQAWDRLPQVVFWRKVMQLGRDSSIVSIAHNRLILDILPRRTLDSLSKSNLLYTYKKDFSIAYGLSSPRQIFITSGRRSYYKFEETLEQIDQAIHIFSQEGTDPWYGQAILLIESPGALRKSSVGAYGPFQLMHKIARDFGLVISGSMDERADLEKSAQAAAQFLREVCIPETKELLDKFALNYREDELWFRLLVLHVYHAGIGNVNAAMKSIHPIEGGSILIQKLWRTQRAHFGNASQNYSQVALAALLELESLIYARQGSFSHIE